jgi:hypothetical protein
MYLRTTARSNADGSRVRYFQLAENVWDPDKGQAVAKVVHNFGRADAQSEESLRRLAQSILRAVGSAEELRDRDDLEMLDARPIGAVWVLDALWKELGIAETLRKLLGGLGAKHPYERALFLLVAHRAIAPSSKLECWSRWRRDGVYLPSADPVRLQDVYRCMDFFLEHKEQIERAVYFKVADLLNVDVDLIFYDTTSLHFEIDEEDEVTQRRTSSATARRRPTSRCASAGTRRTGAPTRRRSSSAWPSRATASRSGRGSSRATPTT